MTINTPTKRVLLIGWDAADWKMMHPLIDAGKMPTLERFLNQGVMGNLSTLLPVLSPMLWTSIATGKRAYKHGIYGFSEPDPVSGTIRPVTNLSRKTKAMWNILNQNDKNTITIGWWPSHPVEPLSRGVMVSNHYHRATGPIDRWPMQQGTVHPPRLTEILKELRFHPSELGQDEIFTFLPALLEMNQAELDEVAKDPRMTNLVKIIADCTSVQSAATVLMQNEPWDLMSVYFDAIDHFGYFFMKYHPPRQAHIPEKDYEIYKDALESGFRYHDMQLNTLLQLAGEETLVIIVSDHGFHPDHLRPRHIPNEPAGPAAEHRPFGMFAARGPGIKRDAIIHGASLLDICPTILHHFGLPVGEDMDGKVLLDIYEDPSEVQRIPSWDKVDGDAGRHPPEHQIAPEESKEALDQLVALGYIDPPGEDQSKALNETVRELDYNQAQAWMDGGHYAEAAEILERLYQRWPLEHRFGIKLSLCYRNLKRTVDLRTVVTSMQERRLQEAQEAQALILKQGWDDPEKLAAANAALAELPATERSKQERERSELFSRAQPNFIALRFLEASADLADGQLDRALKTLNDIEGKPGETDVTLRTLPVNALLLRAEIRLRRRDWKEAVSDFEQVMEADDENPAARLGMARAKLGLRDFDQAVEWALSSLGLLFQQPWAHYIHSLALLRGGRWQEAEQAFLLTARFQAVAPAAYRMLARIARRHRNDLSAAAQYRFSALEARQAQRTAATRRADSENEVIILPNIPPLPTKFDDSVAESEIITLVSGLPRSGTSVMMQMLEAAGIPPFTDNHRAADDSNPRGYFEHQRTTCLPRENDSSWLSAARGKSIKVVAPLLPFLPTKVDGQAMHYRVIFMQRPLEEILQSQNAMLKRQGKEPATANIARAYRQQMIAAFNWMQRLATPAMAVEYHQLIDDPHDNVTTLGAFIERRERLQTMKKVVEPMLYRTRSR